MVKVFPRLVESLRGKLPVRTVRLVPGEFFFTRSLDLPPGILPSDIHSFAEFSLESLSPFPMEQLSWGFLTLPGSPNILVYGAYRETLIRNGFTDLEKDSHVYPGFIVGTPREFTEPSVEFRLFDTTLSAIGFAPRNAVPQWVTSARLPDSESTGDPVKAARQRLLNNIDSSAYAVSDATLEITGEVEESNEGWQFPATYRIDGTPPSPEDSRSLGLRLDEHGAWFADIRDDR